MPSLFGRGRTVSPYLRCDASATGDARKVLRVHALPRRQLTPRGASCGDVKRHHSQEKFSACTRADSSTTRASRRGSRRRQKKSIFGNHQREKCFGKSCAIEWTIVLQKLCKKSIFRVIFVQNLLSGFSPRIWAVSPTEPTYARWSARAHEALRLLV